MDKNCFKQCILKNEKYILPFKKPIAKSNFASVKIA
jgi:hypothetical protein